MNINRTFKRQWAVILVAALFINLTASEAEARTRLFKGIRLMEPSTPTTQNMVRIQGTRYGHFPRAANRLERYPKTTKYLVASGTALAAYYPSRNHIWGPVPGEPVSRFSPANPIQPIYNGLEWGVMLLVPLAAAYLFFRFRRSPGRQPES